MIMYGIVREKLADIGQNSAMECLPECFSRSSMLLGGWVSVLGWKLVNFVRISSPLLPVTCKWFVFEAICPCSYDSFVLLYQHCSSLPPLNKSKCIPDSSIWIQNQANWWTYLFTMLWLVITIHIFHCRVVAFLGINIAICMFLVAPSYSCNVVASFNQTLRILCMTETRIPPSCNGRTTSTFAFFTLCTMWNTDPSFSSVFVASFNTASFCPRSVWKAHTSFSWLVGTYILQHCIILGALLRVNCTRLYFSHIWYTLQHCIFCAWFFLPTMRNAGSFSSLCKFGTTFNTSTLHLLMCQVRSSELKQAMWWVVVGGAWRDPRSDYIPPQNVCIPMNMNIYDHQIISFICCTSYLVWQWTFSLSQPSINKGLIQHEYDSFKVSISLGRMP